MLNSWRSFSAYDEEHWPSFSARIYLALCALCWEQVHAYMHVARCKRTVTTVINVTGKHNQNYLQSSSVTTNGSFSWTLSKHRSIPFHCITVVRIYTLSCMDESVAMYTCIIRTVATEAIVVCRNVHLQVRAFICLFKQRMCCYLHQYYREACDT